MTEWGMSTDEQIVVLRQKFVEAEEDISKASFNIYAASFFAAMVGLPIPALMILYGFPFTKTVAYAVIGISVGLVLYSAVIYLARRAAYRHRDNAKIDLLQADALQLTGTNDREFVRRLVAINFKYLDQYYEQTKTQANKSFRLAAAAAVFGLGIIVTGIVMMFQGKLEPAYVTTAAGVLSEFIAAIFFYLYNRTVAKMSEYHDKLVITQNVSLALKIAEGLKGEAKATAQIDLIGRLSDNVNHFLTRTAGNKPEE